MKIVLVLILANLMLCGCGAQTESKSDKYTTIKICTVFVDSKTGNRIEYQYDPNGKWIKEMQYGEDGSKLAELKHEFKYDKTGNCICIKTTKDGEEHNVVNYKYDDVDHIISEDANYNCDAGGNYISYIRKNFEYEDENPIRIWYEWTEKYLTGRI